MLYVLIIEPHDEVATALGEVISSARYIPIVRRHVDSLADLGVTPTAIVIRIGHADVSRLPPDRPPIVGIVSNEKEAEEAERLHCEVVLRAPSEIRRLCAAVRSLSQV